MPPAIPLEHPASCFRVQAPAETFQRATGLSAFERPDHLLKKEGVQGVPNPLTSSRNELWHLFWRWDAVKRLCLAVEGEWDSSKVCNLFCLSKPDGELRQIIDRRPRNLAETPPPADGPKMGHCSVFLGLVVPQKGCLRGSLDDLRNFYHAFKVSQERALSTVVGPTWCAKDFWNSQAVAALRKRRPDLNISPSTRVAACFAGLSMGDHYAPAIAQLSHEKVLEKFGALRAEEHLKLGCPLPRAPLGHYSGICIDDKVSLQIFPSYVPESASAQEAPGRDLEACAQADEAYIAVGLESHPKKKFRRASEFKAWGAHFEGNQGLVGMDRAKLVSLCANVCPQVYGTDASPSGVGIVTCHVGQDDMRSKDIEGEPSAPAVPAVSLIFGNFEQISFTSCGRELFERFRANCPRVHDMTPSQFAVDFVEVYSGRVGLLWLAPPCTTFSLALQPLEGPLTAAAAVYPLSLCQEVARLAAKLSKAEKMHQAESLKRKMRWMMHLGRPGLGQGGFFLAPLYFWLLVAVTPQLVLGPRPASQPRDRKDLERGRVTEPTAQLRARLWQAFMEWVEMEEPGTPPFLELIRADPIRVAMMVEEYGRVLYEQGSSRKNYAETLNALVQKHAYVKHFLTGPWRLLTTWESLWPGKVHPPCPLPLLQAMVTTAVAWEWFRFALLLLIGFYALLRPCELISLTVKDFILSSDSGCDSVMFIKLRMVKSRTRGAKMQSVRLDVPYVVAFTKKCFKVMARDEKIWCYSTRATLANLITPPPSPVRTKARCVILLRICKALRFLHLQSPAIMHGDLKPGNILVPQTMQPKLTDFGLARMIKNIDEGVLFRGGTRRWSAPESMRSRESGARPEEVTISADIWSLGRVCYFTVTGELPLEEFGPDATPPTGDDVPLQEECLELCASCGLMDPSARPSISEVHSRLWHWLPRKAGEGDKLPSMAEWLLDDTLLPPDAVPPRLRGCLDISSEDGNFETDARHRL
ncbi:Tnni3k [Symbiodinium natans]|uniref:Tnni3k protein n=1 Tax=Symbiodinium natans TaxID=878477 RepID=A0A812MG69_9DINO|nr:Tnni3k [Symbiodinium natans]